MPVTHVHARATSTAERRAVGRAIALTSLLLAAEVAGGFLSGSLALLSDAGHVLTDLVALSLTTAAIRASARPPDRRRTFGYYRLEIFATLANGVLLTLFAAAILRESWERFSDPVPVRLPILLPVAAAGFLVNLVSAWWLRRAGGGLVTRSAMWHAAADGASSLLVILAGAGMAVTGRWWIDPAAGVLVVGILLWGSFRLLRDAVDVLLESTPPGLDLAALERTLLGIEGVDAVHDLHVWCLTSGVHAFAGHLRVGPGRLTDTDRILAEARDILRDSFGIDHTTMQVESDICERIACALGADGETAGADARSAGAGDRGPEPRP